jgi:hypothetical protein
VAGNHGRGPAHQAAADYSEAGLPWFDYYAADLETLAGAPSLTMVKGVVEMAAEKGEQVLGPDGHVDPGMLIGLRAEKTLGSNKRPVRESLV